MAHSISQPARDPVDVLHMLAELEELVRDVPTPLRKVGG